MSQASSAQPQGTLVLGVGGGVSKSHRIPGAGGGLLDAFPGLPFPRHKASFLPLVPRLPRGAWGAGLGVEGGLMGRDILMLSPTMLGWGHKGKSWQGGLRIPPARGPFPHLRLVIAGTTLRQGPRWSFVHPDSRPGSRGRGEQRGEWGEEAAKESESRGPA